MTLAAGTEGIWTRSDGRSTLPVVRDLWSHRRGAPTGADLAYLVYLVILTIAVLGVPLADTIVRSLARPDVLPVLLADRAPQVATALWSAGCGLLVLLGALRGPALLTPFFTATLASSAMSRRRPLLWPQLRSAALLVLAGAVLGGLVGGTLLVAGRAAPAEVLALAAAWAGAGLLGHGAWTAGQVLDAGPRRMLAGLGVLLAAVTLMLPVSWGPGIVLPVHGAGGSPWTVVLPVAGLAFLVLGMLRLHRIRGEVLSQQALRWEAATNGASTGDLSVAAAAFRAAPSVGRRWPAVKIPAAGAFTLALLYLRRDLLAMGRTPERLLAAILGTACASAVLVTGLATTGPLRWSAVVIASTAIWMASGAVTDGVRHAVATMGSPSLLGQSAREQVLLHLPAPLLLLLLLAGGSGATAAVLAGASIPYASEPLTVGVPPLLTVLLLVALMVLGRARDAAKGPMPLSLTVPVPSPMGDPSALMMILWQSDALLVAIAAGIILVIAGGAGPLWLLGAILALLVLILGGFHLRLRELQS